ncbi:uncharacterized protein LOC127880343 isoform X1 [Dreissena polymorpha]|nr:uncharacterized protein LOC127880343 isoform X1 [Dreissena polymorpha]
MFAVTMTTDIHALQREYASQKRQHKKHQHIIVTGSVNDVQGQSSIRSELAENNSRVDPLTITTISIDTGNTFDFLDSITPQVIGETKCILVQQTKYKATSHVHKEAGTSQSQTSACGRRRAKILKGRKGRSLSVPAVINEERLSVDLTEGVTSAVSEDLKTRSELENTSAVSEDLKNRSELENDTICGKVPEKTLDTIINPEEKDTCANIDDDVIANNNQDESEQSCSLESQISDKCSINDKEGMQCQINEDYGEPTDQTTKTDHGAIDEVHGNETDGHDKKDLNRSGAFDSDTACETKDDLNQQRLISNHLRTARSLPRFARSLSYNFEPTVQKHDLKVNSEVKANIYHHFNTKKRHLSITSEFGSHTNDHSADARILNPFPVQHLNKNKIKAGAKLGLYKNEKLK